jgi:alpha-mannosidase
MAYFTMWWREQTSYMKERVKELVKNRQLSFANGGWCMHDEATTHYMGMIDQTTRGHDFLKTTFDGYTPRKFPVYIYIYIYIYNVSG